MHRRRTVTTATVTTVLALALTTGCATTWSRGELSPQEFAQAKYLCAREARAAVPLPGPSFTDTTSPMTAGGIALGQGIGVRRAFNALFDACMDAAGAVAQ